MNKYYTCPRCGKEKLSKDDIFNVIEYAKYREETQEQESDFDRGFVYGIQHIRQQIEKVTKHEWLKFERKEDE